MGNSCKFLCCFLLSLSATLIYSQTSVKVSEPRIKLVNDIIHIYYDIFGNAYSDRITVGLEITDAEGAKIVATGLEGDIGENVTSGSNKHITWNPSVDGIFLNAEVFFQISATYSVPIHKEANADYKNYNRTWLVLQSLAVPGLGMSRISGKPHWLRAVAGYGCLAGSVVLSQQAKKNYDDVADLTDYEGKRDLYETAIQQDNISEILTYTAIGIWITDFIWTMIGTRDYKKSALLGSYEGITLRGGVDPLTYIPTVNLTYRF